VTDLITLLTALSVVHAGTGHHRVPDPSHYSLNVCVGYKYSIQLQYSTHQPLTLKMETASKMLEVTITTYRYDSLSEKTTLTILWHIEPLLGDDHESDNKTMATARQQICKYITLLEPLIGSGLGATMEVLFKAVFPIGLLQGYIT
jgi:hypothetical protein